MSRLEKKCVLGATTMHALLLLALLVGPAFFTRKVEPLDIQEITFVPSILTDAMMSNPGGASPGGETQTPPQPQPQPPIAQPQPPTPEPTTQEEVVEPEPVKPSKPQPKTVEPDEPKISDRESDKVQKPKPKQVVVSNKKVSLANRNTSTSKPTTAKSNTSASNNSALASALRSTRSNLGSGLSSGTDVRMPAGQGGGSGASYANYAQEIQRRYKAAYDRQLQVAGDIAEGSAQVETSIVILRDGTVLNSSIVRPSGNAELDKLTRRVLDSVRDLPAFPAGATDSRRTFNIIFDLKPKLNLG